MSFESTPMTTFQILVFDGFEELDVIGVYQALRMAGLAVPLVSLEKQSQIRAFQGLTMVPDGVLSLKSLPDVLVVPGGGWLARADTGAWALAKDESFLTKLRQIKEAGTILASVCTGAMLLAHAGVLQDRLATTNHGAVDDLTAAGAKVIWARVVDDGDIITAGGITCSLDLGLWLVERFVSPEKADQVSEALEFERRGKVYSEDV
jgi:transcriptional regulator GlxA family with amidase domain